MDVHVRIVAILHIIFGALTLIAAGIVFFGLGLAGGITFMQGETEATGILAIVLISVCSLLAVLALPDIIGGWALLAGWSWGRIFVIILGFLHLLNIPFGTILGVYTLWALLRNDEVPAPQRVTA